MTIRPLENTVFYPMNIKELNIEYYYFATLPEKPTVVLLTIFFIVDSLEI